MLAIIFNVLLQYAIIGFVCTVFIDITIRTTKSSEPFTTSEILGVILVWPVVMFSFLQSFFEDFFN